MKIILLIIIAIGVKCIYDARKISQKFFSSEDSNKMCTILKLIGIVMCVICGVIYCMIK